MRNISNTLVEATEHFIKYIKEREFGQSLHLFSSIVEGYEAIHQLTSIASNQIGNTELYLKRIEKSLIVVADLLEHKRFLKIIELAQFSLLPSLNKLNKIVSETSNIKKTYTIGVYLNHANPVDVYPEARINALLTEGEKQNAILIFFSSDDINFKNETINAKLSNKDEWKQQDVGFPNVVHNIAPVSKHQQTVVERKLRRVVPFTSFGVGNKFHLPKIMVKHRRFADLLVPFRMVTDEQMVFDYLNKEKIAVLKPILGARGESIYFVQKKGNRFIISEHRQEKIYNLDNFKKWISNMLLARKFSYLIQQYVECRTNEGEPFDIRAHMQKDKNGKWGITKIYPRIGSKYSILSNISKGGRTEELNELLTKVYGESQGNDYLKQLQTLSMELTAYLDRIHNFSLDELGLDLAIDSSGRLWLHEANNGPQSTYHEEDRAINTIGYAIYIAKHGIVKHNHSQETKGQFNAKSSNLSFADIDCSYRIGMLNNVQDDEKLAIACAYVSYYENIHFFTFTPKDIDYNEMLIKGQFFHNGEWISKIVEYPDVIYDRFRLKGIKGYDDVYQELDGIPFTNEFYGNSLSKLKVYDQIKNTGKFDHIIIPYKKVKRVGDIFTYIEQYDSVIVKPEVGSFARDVHYISKQSGKKYFLAEGEKETEYSEIALRKYLNELIHSANFIVQQYINTRTIDGHPFDIRVHMMKNGKDDWSFASVYPRIGVKYATISSTGSGGYIGELSGFLKRNYPKYNTSEIEHNLKQLSKEIAITFSSFYSERFNEVALDLALDTNANPFLIELNANKPGIIDEFAIARLAIPNAIHLINQDNAHVKK